MALENFPLSQAFSRISHRLQAPIWHRSHPKSARFATSIGHPSFDASFSKRPQDAPRLLTFGRYARWGN
jgi:hypothetical protein